MKELIRRNITFNAANLCVREAAEGEPPSRIITGYAIVFNTPSVILDADERTDVHEIIAPEAITEEVLKGSDIKMTLFHDNQLILARSNKGTGTLRYKIDDHGVYFEFEAPNTVDGDKALELVRRGDISGCSFAFSTYYFDEKWVERTDSEEAGRKIITYTVRRVIAVHDFTLTPDPAYPDTSVEARSLIGAKSKANELAPEVAKQIDEMRKQIEKSLF